MLTILSFSTNPTILPVMDRLVNKNPEWTGLRATDLPSARKLLAERQPDLVLLGAGTGEEERASLQQIIDGRGMKAALINHYGGGSGLLLAEVREATKVPLTR